jgi:hypothetical protein
MEVCADEERVLLARSQAVRRRRRARALVERSVIENELVACFRDVALAELVSIKVRGEV